MRRRKMKKKSSEEAKPKTKKVRFNFYAPEAERVFLAGDFNHWDVDSLPMKRDNKGTWEVSFALPPGRYEYRFWVDGVWQNDPNCSSTVENPFGTSNSLKIVK
jgi:1,4-alpha-glucan branching enzyme